jgi:hypothetical protein
MTDRSLKFMFSAKEYIIPCIGNLTREKSYVSMFEFPCWHMTAGSILKIESCNFVTDNNDVCHELMIVCPHSHSRWMFLYTDCVHHITTTETIKHWTFFNLSILAHTHATSMVTTGIVSCRTWRIFFKEKELSGIRLKSPYCQQIQFYGTL